MQYNRWTVLIKNLCFVVEHESVSMSLVLRMTLAIFSIGITSHKILQFCNNFKMCSLDFNEIFLKANFSRKTGNLVGK